MEIIVTKHAEQRVRERCGCNKKSVKRMAQRAYDKGLRTEDTKGAVRAWLDDKQAKHADNEAIRLYGDKAWMFANPSQPILLTILQIPTELQRKVNDMCRA